MRKLAVGAVLLLCSALFSPVVQAQTTMLPGHDGPTAFSPVSGAVSTFPVRPAVDPVLRPVKLSGPEEVAFGTFNCFDSIYGGNADLTFRGTAGFVVDAGGIRLDRSGFDGSVLCGDLGNALARHANESGCVAAPVRVVTEPSLHVALVFVCHGERNRIVRATAAFASEFLLFPRPMPSAE